MSENQHKLFLNRADLRGLGLWQSNSTLLRWEAAGRFPRRVRFGGTTVAWPRDEVLAWHDQIRSARSSYHYAEL